MTASAPSLRSVAPGVVEACGPTATLGQSMPAARRALRAARAARAAGSARRGTWARSSNDELRLERAHDGAGVEQLGRVRVDEEGLVAGALEQRARVGELEGRWAARQPK
jgi:hypothetical protein